jgi:hypothetical protein
MTVKKLPATVGDWGGIISNLTWPQPGNLFLLVTGVLDPPPPSSSPLAVLATQRPIFSSLWRGMLPITKLPCVPLWFATFKGHEEMHSEAGFQTWTYPSVSPNCNILVGSHYWAQLGGWQHLPYKTFDTLPISYKEEKKAPDYFAVTGQLWNPLT